MKPKTDGLFRNAFSYAGGLIVVISLLLILLSFLLNLVVRRPSPYIGIFTYMIFPGLLTLGLLTALYGLLRESRRRRRLETPEATPYPKIDLNDPHQRKLFALLFTAGCLVAVLLCFVGYNAYTFTDSTAFCGNVCHQVMKPEYTAYLNGPHARVPCVDCHVGPGVPWYVKSKISGVPQVFAVLFDTYSRPIPVPIKNLRPARDICEECHWPQKFYGAQLMQYPHFHYDEDNAAEQISLIVRTGGGTPNLGENAGIHWHMAINRKIYFRATDFQQQHIPWIKVVHSDGSAAIYKDSHSGVSDEALARLPLSLMDCMDCHNRPSHVFLPPETAVDRAMEGGTISRKLPWIKKLAVDALVRNYRDQANVPGMIRDSINGYYATHYPEINKERELLNASIKAITTIYQQNVFSSMNVNWTTYPNNIGHRNWPGCFRCHGDSHYDESGKKLVSSCSVCHTTPQRGPLLPLGATASFTSKEDWHPWPLKGKHARILCDLCHRAGYRPPEDCISCHKFSRSAPMMSGDCGICHIKEQEVKPLKSCTSCHGDLGQLHRVRAHADAGCTACHTPHTWKITRRETCLGCHGNKKEHHAPTLCEECHHFTGHQSNAIMRVIRS